MFSYPLFLPAPHDGIAMIGPRINPVAVVLAALVLAGTGCRTPAPPPAVDEAAAETAIRAVLDAQVDAWNRGDLDAFMHGYVRSDSLRFASGGTVQTGWQTTLDRYRRAYPDREAMGRLSFELYDVRILAPRWALVFGRFTLARAEDRPTGLFTLLFERRAEGWRILADHTSAAP